jgi:hypothetical protein
LPAIGSGQGLARKSFLAPTARAHGQSAALRLVAKRCDVVEGGRKRRNSSSPAFSNEARSAAADSHCRGDFLQLVLPRENAALDGVGKNLGYRLAPCPAGHSDGCARFVVRGPPVERQVEDKQDACALEVDASRPAVVQIMRRGPSACLKRRSAISGAMISSRSETTPLSGNSH